MKNLFLSIIAVFTITLFGLAQAPNGISYQAVVRNSSGDLIQSSPIGLRVNILQGTSTGSSVYAETHNESTNQNGLLSVQVGMGTTQSGSFATINWSNGPYFISTEIDPAGGSNYSITGVSQLLSVPYSKHSETADSIIGAITISSISMNLDTLYLSNGQIFVAGGSQTQSTSYGVINNLGCFWDYLPNSGYQRSGILNSGIASNNVSITISYSGGAGGAYPEQIINSTGVNGLTATLSAGNFEFGGGSLELNITGTPSSSGIAYFGLNIGGQVCNLTYEVFEPVGGLMIGQEYQGGIIAYLLQPGDIGYDPDNVHGIILAPTVSGSNVSWGCEGDLIGGTQTDIGTGENNTSLIVSNCTETNIAAKICDDLSLNGFNDWYLPSIDELAMIFNNLRVNGLVSSPGFNPFWSSSEINNIEVQTYVLEVGVSNSTFKNTSLGGAAVQAIRSF